MFRNFPALSQQHGARLIPPATSTWVCTERRRRSSRRKSGHLHALAYVVPPDPDTHSNAHLRWGDFREVAYQSNSRQAGKIQHRHDIRQSRRYRRMTGVMDNGIGEHRRHGRCIDPNCLGRMALRAHGCRRMPQCAAFGTRLELQFALRAVRPKRPVIPVGIGFGHVVRKVSHQSFPRIRPLVGDVPSPPLTRQVRASFTWDVDSPRSCRTPSFSRFMPCT